jgi:16S rRNA processing protein RimM
VVDVAGVELGRVTGVEHFPAQDMLLVGPARAMLPLVRAFVRSIDVAARRIVVDVPPGLIDPGEALEA